MYMYIGYTHVFLSYVMQLSPALYVIERSWVQAEQMEYIYLEREFFCLFLFEDHVEKYMA